MKLEVLVDRMMQENTYVYYDEQTRQAVIVDPALNFKDAVDTIKRLDLDVKYILLRN